MDYTEGEAVRAARKKKQEVLDARPEGYSSQWAEKQEQALGKLLDREDFSYDLNADALYDQYKEAYIRQGKRAMEDAMGAAAANTGGYGNSYAQTAGQQAYQGYLQELSGMTPEFYKLALEEYLRQGDALRQEYDLLSQREQQDYSRYRDYLSQWMNDRDFAAKAYSDERDADYKRYESDRDDAYRREKDEREAAYRKRTDDRDYAYQLLRDQEKDRQWREEMAYRWATGRS